MVVSDLPGHGLEQRIVETATREFGGLDLLVNNAGIALGKPFEETTDEEFDRIMNVNVRSVFRMTRAAVPHLRARGGGSVINLASIMSSTGGPQLSAYATSKHAVLGLSRGMAVDLGKYGIRVNALCVGIVDTSRLDDIARGPAFDETIRRNVPLGRPGTGEDIANMVIFLSSPAGAWVTGQSYNIDGGHVVAH